MLIVVDRVAVNLLAVLIVILATACDLAPKDASTTPAVAPVRTSAASSTATPARTATPPATVSPTITSSAAPTPPPNALLPPLPSQPALPLGATSLATGTRTVSIAPGAAQDFEAHSLVDNAPPSAALVWTITWRATDPLSASTYRQIATSALGRGKWGTAELGGAGFRLQNDGSVTVYAEISYVVGSR
jgi:hypothetical protein